MMNEHNIKLWEDDLTALLGQEMALLHSEACRLPVIHNYELCKWVGRFIKAVRWAADRQRALNALEPAQPGPTTLNELAVAVREVRKLQTEYFKRRNPTTLAIWWDAERRLDALVGELLGDKPVLLYPDSPN